MDADRVLALALARHLDALTPAELRVLAWAAMSSILLGPGDGSVGHVLLESGYYEGDPAGFAESALNEVQEYMIEWIVKSGWPPIDPERPHDRQSAARLPPPGAALEAAELHLWYGDRRRPSLRLPSITEDALGSLRADAERGDDALIEALWGRWLGGFLRLRGR